ncbi:hypothetical protein [Candidatus Chloroploca sp. Khr17]|uniref:hypothetical protein n=1 Tax=Candidatus Chloroploca sp. Khr17 TaxID=2496869 RepID=UPI00101CD851|nr:hypothetical protein [Candidatus Chloroploca sp. Khr17]
MKRRKGWATPPPGPTSRANHRYPPNWQRNDWLVPFVDGAACIHHGHDTDADDHSRCGPAIFCCPHAAIRYVTLFPDSREARATWQPTNPSYLTTWLHNGVHVFYFVFCDPDHADGLLAIGLGGSWLHDALWHRTSLDTHALRADRLM